MFDPFCGDKTKVNATARHILIIRSLIVLSVFWFASLSIAQDFPVGDAYDKNQAEPDTPMGFNSRNDTPGVAHKSLQPHLSSEINEGHPFPESLKLFSKGAHLPKHYTQLLSVPPSHQVQSLIFNPEKFANTRRICVTTFDNTTSGPFKDPQANQVISNQISNELRNTRNYTVVHETEEDARMKIVATPGKTSPAEKAMSPKEKTLTLLERCPRDKYDAILVGAVTKYLDSYIDRHGKKRESLSSGVEFGAYLIEWNAGKDPQAGDVLWGARYVGSQELGLRNIFQGKTQWLSKQEQSRIAMKSVLKAFNQTKR